MRKKTIVAAALFVVLFSVLAVLVNTGLLLGPEQAIYQAIARHMSPGLTAVLRTVTRFGDPVPVVMICLFFLAVPVLRRRAAVPVVASAAIAAGLNKVLKHLFLRERPTILWLIEESGFSFPSGHSATSAAMYTALALLVLQSVRHPAKRVLLACACFAMSVIIGLSRVYLGVHYIGDVLGGWTLGVAVALVVHSLWQRRCAQKQ